MSAAHRDTKRSWGAIGVLLALLIGNLPTHTLAQQLDLDHTYRPDPVQSRTPRPRQPAPTRPLSAEQPISVTVTKSLYLPPAMYGHWNIIGTLIRTNAPESFGHSASDLWALERQGDQVTVTNLVNGASAAVNVDQVQGDTATFHRMLPLKRNVIFRESPTITVQGDKLHGTSLHQRLYYRNGKLVREEYGLYELQATRINQARTQFRPGISEQEPELIIEDVQRLDTP